MSGIFCGSNKKGSLEISIQAIVIVVLAMTLLGLGLGFIRGMFKNITGTTEDVTEQVRQKILDDLIQGDKKISFPRTDVTIDKGGATVLTIGLRNKKDTPLRYHMEFEAVSDPTGQPFTLDNPAWFQYDSSIGKFILSSADSEVKSVRLSIPTSIAAGSYFLNFKIVDEDASSPDDIYASKDFFIVVRG